MTLPRCLSCLLLIFVEVAVAPSNALNLCAAEDGPEWRRRGPRMWDELEREEKVTRMNAAIAAGVVAYGLAFWDYGKTSPNFSREGWFGEDTKYGGADKLGHAYTAYLFANLLASRYEQWGYTRADASQVAAWSSLGAVSLIEVGDAFSHYGFSYEDCLFNFSGALLAYVRRANPRLEDALDFRIEYVPSRAVRHGESSDILTDYSGMKHLLAYRLASVPALKETALRFFELHAGYYTRGFVSDDAEYRDHEKRAAYVGIGISSTELLRAAGHDAAAEVFRYHQLPYTYLSVEHAASRPGRENP